MYLAQITLVASVIAATVLQFVGALCVREYAKSLWMQEIRQEARIIACIERRSKGEERLSLPALEEARYPEGEDEKLF